MGKYTPGSGAYQVRYGVLLPEQIPHDFVMADWVHKKNEKQFQFYTRLEESVKAEGFRNPVMVYEKPNERTFPYGGSRVYMAHRLQIPVPAIITDWVGTFKDWELITSVKQALSKFTDLPSILEFHPQFGCQFWGCEQTQLSADHVAHWNNVTAKTDTCHMKRRMTRGRYFYRATGELSDESNG